MPKYKIKKFRTQNGRKYWILTKDNFETMVSLTHNFQAMLRTCMWIEKGVWEEIKTTVDKDWYIPVSPARELV